MFQFLEVHCITLYPSEWRRIKGGSVGVHLSYVYSILELGEQRGQDKYPEDKVICLPIVIYWEILNETNSSQILRMILHFLEIRDFKNSGGPSASTPLSFVSTSLARNGVAIFSTYILTRITVYRYFNISTFSGDKPQTTLFRRSLSVPPLRKSWIRPCCPINKFFQARNKSIEVTI